MISNLKCQDLKKTQGQEVIAGRHLISQKQREH